MKPTFLFKKNAGKNQSLAMLWVRFFSKSMPIVPIAGTSVFACSRTSRV